MTEIDITKHTKYSLEFIFNEADKFSDQLLNGISANTNRSFVLFAFLTSVFSYSFVNILEKDFKYLLLLIGSTIGILIIRKNLFPSEIKFKGSKPEKIMLKYFDDFSNEELEKELLATQIKSYNTAINENESTIDSMIKRFSKSIWCLVISFFTFLIIFLISFIVECSNT